jgi:hypothetical protein
MPLHAANKRQWALRVTNFDDTQLNIYKLVEAIFFLYH